MMGVQETPARLFYEICLEEHVPFDHLLRGIDRHLDLANLRLIVEAFLQPDGSTLDRPRADDAYVDRRLLHGHPLRAAALRRGPSQSGVSLVLSARPRRQGSGSLDLFRTGMAAFARAMRCVICLRASFSAAWRRAWSGPRVRGRCEPHRRRRQQAALGSKQGLEP